MPASCIPLRMGVKFNPPTVILLYSQNGRGTRKRSMPLRDFSKTSDCYQHAERLKKRHEIYLKEVATVRIEKFVRLLQETMKGKTISEALDAVKMEFSINFDEDMNKLSDRDLQRRKELMDINFQKNQIKHGDPGFVYDKQVK